MDFSFFLGFLLFVIAMAAGFFLLKYLERKLGLIREVKGEEEEELSLKRPPAFIRINDIEYIVDWFIRRDKKINNPLLLSMDIVDHLSEETETEIYMLMHKRLKFNLYLEDLIDFLPKVDQAEKVLKDYYRNNKGIEIDDNNLGNIKSYIIAKIRIMGWLYYNVNNKFYNQRDSEFLDFDEYVLLEEEGEEVKDKGQS